MDEQITKIHTRLHALETRSAVDDVHRANVEKRLTSIEDTLKWLVRLILGALIMGVIAYALRGGFTG
ncbi:hemolysin XhlA family protein [Aestuariibius sp. HNIBRBA575]|uniref:hemolysin XhlA family protein n=1 Tax=Aestuariibius sp. HNIBRBA575 TaxID=3233343 RepID=UPI0034A43D75